MVQPEEMKPTLPVNLSNGAVSTTTHVWNILVASRDRNLKRVKELVDECPELIYAQYNYTPPIHFAVREGHLHLVSYLLENGALDPAYITYPFKESLLTVARDSGYQDIVLLLQQYLSNPGLCRFRGDNGEIHYNKDVERQQFQRAVNHNEIEKIWMLFSNFAKFEPAIKTGSKND